MTGGGDSDIELFEKVLQLSPSEREAFMNEACRDEPGQRRRIEALLRSNDRVGNFLEEPPTGSIVESRARVTDREKPGDWVGRYQLVEQIGEGGCGVVFLAEQREPVHR